MKYQANTRRRAGEYEKAIVEFWKKNRVFEKSIEQRDINNSYVFMMDLHLLRVCHITVLYFLQL